MDKDTKNLLIKVFLVIFCAYFAMAFVVAEINPFLWNMPMRLILIALVLLGYLYTLIPNE